MLLRKLITKIAIVLVPLLLDAALIGAERWLRNRRYKDNKKIYGGDE